MNKLLLLCVLPACLPKTINSQGPDARLKVMPTTGPDFDQGNISPYMTIDSTSGNYDFALMVSVDFGRTVTVGKEASEGYRYAEVNDFSGTVMPGAMFTEADFTVDTSLDAQHRREWMSKQMYSIPGSMKGQKALFHMEATDTLGLSSNVVDITADLQ